MTDAFTADAARALGGPDWLVAAAPRGGGTARDVSWPTAEEEIWRYSRIGELDLDALPARSRADELGQPGDERAPGGGPWAAEAGQHAAMIVVRDGRVVHHELDPGARGQGRAGLRHRDVRRRRRRASCSGAASSTSEDAFTVLHDAFLAGGAFVQVPAGVVVEDPILVLHWCEGDGRASFPHTLVSLGEHAEATVLDRFGSPRDRSSRRRGHRAARRRQRAPALPLGAGARLAHVAPRVAARASSAATQSCAPRRSRSAATTRGCAARRCSQGEGAESDQLAVYFGDGTQMLDFRTLQDHDAPRTRSDLLFKGAVEDTARSVYSGLVHLRPDGPEGERVADQPQPRADRRRERGVDPEPRDRGQRREVLARFDGRPDRRRAALLPREPRASRPKTPSA